jgi:hypothetical protein
LAADDVDFGRAIAGEGRRRSFIGFAFAGQGEPVSAGTITASQRSSRTV